MQDQHGKHICHVERAEAQRLLKAGYAVTYGTKKKPVLGIRLTVSLAKANGEPVNGGRAHHIANLAGTRFLFRQKLATERTNAYVYRHKKLETTESPEHALLRILTPPALESSVYTPRYEATDAERAADPGKQRRRNVVEIFALSRPPAAARQRAA